MQQTALGEPSAILDLVMRVALTNPLGRVVGYNCARMTSRPTFASINHSGVEGTIVLECVRDESGALAVILSVRSRNRVQLCFNDPK
jgi:hypothetical protein